MNENETKDQEDVILPAYKVIDTIETYMQSMYVRVETNGNGAVCAFCGKKTSFDNRHVCPVCWKLYKDELMFFLKGTLSDVEFKIVE